MDYINPDSALLFIFIASEAELKSLAIRNRWGTNRINSLNNFLNLVDVVDISQLSVNIYAQIDAYSQRLNPNFENYSFDKQRNMGKNDLLIASLAALLGLRLVTTDADFDHLHNVFFEVRKIKPSEFIPFF
jgi:tRNA(fMet)-specific endonuclease VapC